MLRGGKQIRLGRAFFSEGRWWFQLHIMGSKLGGLGGLPANISGFPFSSLGAISESLADGELPTPRSTHTQHTHSLTHNLYHNLTQISSFYPLAPSFNQPTNQPNSSSKTPYPPPLLTPLTRLQNLKFEIFFLLGQNRKIIYAYPTVSQELVSECTAAHLQSNSCCASS